MSWTGAKCVWTGAKCVRCGQMQQDGEGGGVRPSVVPPQHTGVCDTFDRKAEPQASPLTWVLGSPLCPSGVLLSAPQNPANWGSRTWPAFGRCHRWWQSESSRLPSLRQRAPTVHTCTSPRSQVVQGRAQVGILLVSDCGSNRLEQEVDRQTNAHSSQGSRKEETHRAVTLHPTCAPTPVVSPGA